LSLIVIQEHNRALRDIEEDDELNGETPLSKRPKTNNSALSDDEAAMAAQLGNDKIVPSSDEEEGSKNTQQHTLDLTDDDANYNDIPDASGSANQTTNNEEEEEEVTTEIGVFQDNEVIVCFFVTFLTYVLFR